MFSLRIRVCSGCCSRACSLSLSATRPRIARLLQMWKCDFWSRSAFVLLACGRNAITFRFEIEFQREMSRVPRRRSRFNEFMMQMISRNHYLFILIFALNNAEKYMKSPSVQSRTSLPADANGENTNKSENGEMNFRWKSNFHSIPIRLWERTYTREQISTPKNPWLSVLKPVVVRLSRLDERSMRIWINTFNNYINNLYI